VENLCRVPGAGCRVPGAGACRLPVPRAVRDQVSLRAARTSCRVRTTRLPQHRPG